MRTPWDDHAFVVLAYGDSPFLAGCLRSLAAQTVASRVVVATSTPSEHVTAAARDAGAELRINPRREGIGADWNYGLAVAGARYVTLAHQDDVYSPDFLARTRALFARHPDGALAFTGFRQIDDDGRPVRSAVSHVKHLLSALILGRTERVAGRRCRLFLSFGNPLPCSAVTFDTKALPRFRFSTELASNLDWDAWWRLRGDGKLFLHAPQPLIGRRHNDLTETSRLIRDGRRQAEDEAMFARIWPRPVARSIAWLYRASYGQGPAPLGGRLMRFGLVGAALTLLSYVVFISALGAGLHYMAAATLGWAAGIVASYFLNKSFTFALGTRLVWAEFAQLIVGYVLQLGLSLAGYAILIGGLGVAPRLAFIVNTLLIAAFSFAFMQYAVFRPRA